MGGTISLDLLEIINPGATCCENFPALSSKLGFFVECSTAAGFDDDLRQMNRCTPDADFLLPVDFHVDRRRCGC